MSEDHQSEPPQNLDALTEQTADEAKLFVREALALFAEHNKNLSAGLARFNGRQKQAEEKIKNGGYRTSGRIV